MKSCWEVDLKNYFRWKELKEKAIGKFLKAMCQDHMNEIKKRWPYREELN